ncbi:MAG TPA: enoyl-CoA hydratase/isomerase family protein [Phycisphaerales bacterium]|nr:enoyl-CoA hydratase/isomerase family protein [Phycisphaerales bacterium]
MTDLATLTIESRVATLTLNRADKRNALSMDLLDALLARADELAKRDDVTVCVLTGAGRVFCAGMDLRAVLGEPGAPFKLLSRIAELTLKLRSLPMVTLARVNGAAIGGGCGLVCVCDLAVTHPDSKMGFPEVDLGVCPAVVAPWLVKTVGAGAARRVLLQGGTLTGQRCFEIGLVSHCVPSEQLDSTVAEMAARLAQSGALALRETKRLLNDLDEPALSAAVRKGAEISARVVDGEEARRMLSKAYGS